MATFKMILVLSLTLIDIYPLIECKKLKLVFVVHRHGDRTPVFGWPTNPYNDEKKYWADGLGMLDSKGKQRMYSIGKYIRKRYKDFLTDNPREVYVRSTEKERCLESVSLLLAGLYPPVNRWKWNNDLGKVWQPFPIRTTNFSHDGLLYPEAICPSAEKDLKEVMLSESVQNFFKKHEDIVKLIEEKCDLKFVNYHVGRDIFSTLEIQKLNGLKLPNWTNGTVYQKLQLFSHMAFYFDGTTQLQHRMRAGLLLKEIAKNIGKSLKNSGFGHKIFIYSTHDTYVAVFLSALNAFNMKSPPFGATVFLELYEVSKKRHEIELHYLNETETERPYRLSLNCGQTDPNCESRTQSCSFEEFLASIKDLIPGDWEEECKREREDFKFSIKKKVVFKAKVEL